MKNFLSYGISQIYKLLRFVRICVFYYIKKDAIRKSLRELLIIWCSSQKMTLIKGTPVLTARTQVRFQIYYNLLRFHKMIGDDRFSQLFLSVLLTSHSLKSKEIHKLISYNHSDLKKYFRIDHLIQVKKSMNNVIVKWQLLLHNKNL